MLRRILVVLMMLVGLTAVGIGTANAVPANNTCYNTDTDFTWLSSYSVAFTTNVDITAQATFCIAADGNRMVFQANGDLTVWSGLHSGGSLLWQSHTGNLGASQLRMQNNGDVVIWKGNPTSGGTVLWNTGSYRAYPTPAVYSIAVGGTAWWTNCVDANVNSHNKFYYF